MVWGRVTGVFIMPRFQGPFEPFPHFLRRQNSHCILHADRDLAGLIEEWKSLQARAKPSRSQTAAHAVNEWAERGCETVREQGCLTEWMKMIQLETGAKSKDPVRKWESSNLKVANSCQNVRVTKSRASGRAQYEGTRLRCCYDHSGDWLRGTEIIKSHLGCTPVRGGREEKGGERVRERWLVAGKIEGGSKRAEKNLTTLLEQNKEREAKNCFFDEFTLMHGCFSISMFWNWN